MSRACSPPMPPGTRIGERVTVLGTIDGGATDPVLIVWHHDAWCPMACKVFRSRAQAEREASVLGKLSHPYTVRFMGIEPPGLLLMEFVEGPTLGSLIDRARAHRLGVSDAIRVAIHIGSALRHVHDRGYIHLDVKPANVIISPGGRPMLFDFGSARRIGAKRPAEIIGTNRYIAPEECALARVTPAADVFSLGVTLYEMLTGEFPFGKGSRGNPFPQTHAKLRPARSRRPALPGRLDAIVSSCLSREPEQRPDLEQLIPALHDFIVVGPKMWPEGFRPGDLREPDDDPPGRRIARNGISSEIKTTKGMRKLMNSGVSLPQRRAITLPSKREKLLA